LIDFDKRTNIEDFRQAINQMFEFLMMLEHNLQTDSWMILITSIFEKLYQTIKTEIIKQDSKNEDLKDIFVHVLKKVFLLLVSNQTKPVELIHKNFQVLYGLSISQNKSILDLLMFNLNEVIGETIKHSENPWIDEIWEETIAYLTKVFHDYFPSEVI
jgi:hypothetical protein